jgi:cell division protein FtsZ
MTLHEVEEAAKLIQESSHEDANIIFGAVIDDALEGDLRVTVIATGLDDGRIGRGRDRDVRERDRGTEFGKVMPLRRDAEPVRETAPVAIEEPYEPARPVVRETSAAAPTALESAEEFDSPFEDEYDEPAFLRRKKRDDGDRELPAFLRRSAD